MFISNITFVETELEKNARLDQCELVMLDIHLDKVAAE